jgi:uncharacterized protein YrrD
MLFSFEELRGYQIRAADGGIGSVDDVLFENTTSTVRYLVVETGSWLFGRKVLLRRPPSDRSSTRRGQSRPA